MIYSRILYIFGVKVAAYYHSLVWSNSDETFFYVFKNICDIYRTPMGASDLTAAVEVRVYNVRDSMFTFYSLL
jgi:hypothetical protein